MNNDNYNKKTIGVGINTSSIFNKSTLAAATIVASENPIPSPLRRQYYSKHFDWLIPVGNDHTATLTMDIDTLGELQKTLDPDTATYGDAIEHLRKGGIITRKGWNDKAMFVFKQVPSRVPADVVPKMSSLPESVKNRMMKYKMSPDYQNQMVIVDEDGCINSWVASSSDTFATDWILL